MGRRFGQSDLSVCSYAAYCQITVAFVVVLLLVIKRSRLRWIRHVEWIRGDMQNFSLYREDAEDKYQ